MAKHDPAGHTATPVPLRAAAQQPDASLEERYLASGLAALYPENSADAPGAPQAAMAAGWERLQEPAQRLARQRRRSYLLRELVAAWLPRPLQLAAAGLLLLLLLSPADRPAVVFPPAAVPSAVVVNSVHAGLSGVSGTLRLRVGAEVKGDNATVTIEQEDRTQTRIALSQGAVRLQVPPLPGRGKLVVVTSDAEVIVHGTRFTVRKIDDSSTSVAVDEGLVEVRPQGGGRSSVFLRPGESITVPSLSRYKETVRSHAGELIDAGRCDDPEHSVERYLELAPAGADISAAQYLKGFCSAQRKDGEEAVRWFERAAATSQDPVRADNALARAAKLRADRSEPDGAVAWRRYLERFPQGLHRESAERFLAGPR